MENRSIYQDIAQRTDEMCIRDSAHTDLHSQVDGVDSVELDVVLGDIALRLGGNSFFIGRVTQRLFEHVNPHLHRRKCPVFS